MKARRPQTELSRLGANLRRLRVLRGWTQQELAARSGVPNRTICGYEAGERNPQANTLALLAAALRCTAAEIDQTFARIHPDSLPPDSPVIPATRSAFLVPVLGMAQAAGYQPSVEALDDFLVGFGDRQHAFYGAKEGQFALEVSGTSLMPRYPPGTMLLVGAGEFPKRGDLVVARLADSREVVVKLYDRRNNTITLSSINPEGRTIEWHVKDAPGYVLWIYPVLRIEIDPRKELPPEPEKPQTPA